MHSDTSFERIKSRITYSLIKYTLPHFHLNNLTLTILFIALVYRLQSNNKIYSKYDDSLLTNWFVLSSHFFIAYFIYWYYN